MIAVTRLAKEPLSSMIWSIIQEVADPQTTNIMSSRFEAKSFQKRDKALLNPSPFTLANQGSSSIKIDIFEPF